MAGRLAGKVAVVTGGSTGFGRGIAAIYAREGAKVVVGDLKPETNDGNYDEAPELTTTTLVEKLGSEAVYQHCDVTKQADVAALVAKATERFGRIDIMVNNAGIYRGAPFLNYKEEDLDAVFAVVAKGTFFGCQEAVKAMIAQGEGGAIVNVCSSAGIRPYPHQTVYNMSKHAQCSVTQCVALEFGRHNIRANAICPTHAKTSMSFRGAELPGADARMSEIIPLRGWAEIRDIANLAVYLGSDESRFITGSLIPVDGGEIMGHHVSRFAPQEWATLNSR